MDHASSGGRSLVDIRAISDGSKMSLLPYLLESSTVQTDSYPIEIRLERVGMLYSRSTVSQYVEAIDDILPCLRSFLPKYPHSVYEVALGRAGDAGDTGGASSWDGIPCE